LLYLALVLLFAVAFSIGCSSGGNDADGSRPSVPATPADAARIRGVDLSKSRDAQNMLRQLGSATLATRETLYVDVTGDQREEAFVPISSGGTLGNVAYLGFTLRGDTPALILTRTLDRSNAGGLRLLFEDGKLLEYSGEYGPQDPNCCPSVMRKTYFRWDGSKLQVETEEKVPNPAGQKKE
jgi:hypothetical protein